MSPRVKQRSTHKSRRDENGNRTNILNRDKTDTRNSCSSNCKCSSNARFCIVIDWKHLSIFSVGLLLFWVGTQNFTSTFSFLNAGSEVLENDTISATSEKGLNDNLATTSSGNAAIPKKVLEFKTSIINDFVPKPIVADGRKIEPTEIYSSKGMRVYIYEDFLSAYECDGLMRVHIKHVQTTSQYDPILCFDDIITLTSHLKLVGQGHLKVTEDLFVSGTTCLNATFSSSLRPWFSGKWSYSTAFYPGESPFTHTFTERAERATGLDRAHGGKFQITSYPKGVGYRSHTDCVLGGSEKRDRYATILVYLQDVQEGGETVFTDLDIKVKPKKGRALVFLNMNRRGECLPVSLHEAAQVVDGHKFILQRWYYYQNFYSLGQRPAEPSLPPRVEGQPRVSCNMEEQGSCRWYDEWNYEHITHYELNKQNLH